MEGAQAIATADDFVPVTLDPTRGQLMGLLVQAPDLRERVAQGGVIGYLIIGAFLYIYPAFAPKEDLEHRIIVPDEPDFIDDDSPAQQV